MKTMFKYKFADHTGEIQRDSMVVSLRKAGFTASRESDTLRTNATVTGIGLVWGNTLDIEQVAEEEEKTGAFHNSYWNHRGQFQDQADQLRKRIPVAGQCPADSPKLDLFRRASNCYYDLFNNGLGNRAAEFRSIFHFSPARCYPGRGNSEIDFENEEMNFRLNTMLDLIIVEAASEQGLL